MANCVTCGCSRETAEQLHAMICGFCLADRDQHLVARSSGLGEEERVVHDTRDEAIMAY
jgi:hypothetical protein